MAATEINVQMQQRRDTASGWTSAGETLLSGELAYETDTGKFKIGDGTTAWSSLNYLPIPDNTGDLDSILSLTTSTPTSPSLTYDTQNLLNLNYGSVQLGVGIDSASPFGSYLQSRDNTNVAKTLNLNPAGGNVGVGTTNPSHKLTVSGGNILLDSNNQLRFGTSDAAAIEASGADGTGGTRYMRFLVNDEKARIDSSGRLLVGASLSSNFIGTGFGAFLQVQESTSTLAMGIERPTDDTSGGSLNFRKTRSTTEGGVTPVQNNDNLGELRFAGTNGLGAILAAKISAQVDGTPAGPNPGPVSMPGRLVFSTTASGTSTPAERMIINNSGQILLNTSNSTPIHAARSIVFTLEQSGDIAINHSTANSSGDVFARFGYDGTQIGSITQNGIAATAYNTSSDYRLKENITAVTDGITRLQQLKPSRFNFIADPDKTVDGFIAHEVQTIVPEAITGEKDAVDDEGNPQYQGIDQSKMVPLVVAALQECIKKVEALEAEVASLKARA